MIGFRAVAEDVAVDHDELAEARWFTRDEVRALAGRRRDSIESYLVATWLDEGPRSGR
jgi:NAD+ diphosphatase